MKLLNMRLSLLAIGTTAALLSTSAHAVWTFDQSGVTGIKNYQSCSSPNSGSGTSACSGSGTLTNAPVVDSTTVSLSGFAVQNAGYKETYVNNTLTPSGGTSGGFNTTATISDGKTGTFAQSGNWVSKSLTHYSGGGQGMTAGLNDGAAPAHAIDNKGYTESVLLSFSASTVLTSIGLGYTNGSSSVDISLFRWTGSSAPTLAGTAAATMTGWELVGNYGDLMADETNPYNAVNTAGKTSSWWLISAYNSGFTQSAGTENRGTPLTNGDDYFKLYAVAGTKCANPGSNGVCGGTPSTKVSEPATLALTGVALVGVAGLRRRKVKLAA